MKIIRADERSGVEVEGAELGCNVTVLVVDTHGPGQGPALHVHPYAEIFVLHQGRARYTIGEDEVVAGPGDVLFAPAEVPHAFTTLDEGPFRATDIHLSPRWIQTDLE